MLRGAGREGGEQGCRAGRAGSPEHSGARRLQGQRGRAFSARLGLSSHPARSPFHSPCPTGSPPRPGSGNSSPAPSSAAPSAPDVLSLRLQPHCTLEDFTPPGAFSKDGAADRPCLSRVPPAHPSRASPGLTPCLLQHFPGRVDALSLLDHCRALCRTPQEAFKSAYTFGKSGPEGPGGH